MKVKESSWHYRLIRFADMTVPNNLCPYCRQVLWATLFLLFVGALCALCAFFVLSIPLHWFFPKLIMPALIGGILLIFVLSMILQTLVSERRKKEKLLHLAGRPQCFAT